jgi:hypothetical protein
MLRVAPTFLVLLVAGCATTATPSAALLEAPEERCEKIGALAVRTSTELLAPEDALQASAVNELRQRAALRGATHLVAARTPNAASMAYGTTAAASGIAYHCPEDR